MSIRSKPGSMSMSAGPESCGEILEERCSDEQGQFVRRYQKGRFLGKGGFARCYEVRELSSGRLLAAKIIEKSTLTKGRAQQKLMSEIRIHRSMDHPGIVHFEGYFEDARRVYMLLEMCPNQTLKETVKRRKRLHELEVQCYLGQLIPAMRHIHGMNVIHRDLKLGNLFLGKNMELKVGDFGLAAKLDFAGERRRTVCGTPNYIAPEVLDSKVLGHSFEADIWSLGVIIYTMLIGRPPFETSNVKHTYKRIRANDYHIPEDVHLSAAARDLLHQILVLNPSKRPSLAEILDSRFMTSNPIPPLLPLSSLIGPLPPAFLEKYAPSNGEAASLGGTMVATARTETAEASGRPLESARGKVMTKPPSERCLKTALTQTDAGHRAKSPCAKTILAVSPRPFGSQVTVGTDGPIVCVAYYLDYTDKYGVGYVLTSGVLGFYFNDMTNLLMLPHRNQYAYSDFYQRSDSAIKYYPATGYPSELGKKARILSHFTTYCSRMREETQSHSQPQLPKKAEITEEQCAVKRAVKTKSGLLLKLTNGVLQTFFTDLTTLTISFKRKTLQFSDKTGAKETAKLTNDFMLSASERIVKRYKYTLGVLNLLGAHRGARARKSPAAQT